MNLGTFGIAFALLISVLLLLWFVIGSRGQWWLKVPVIAATMFLSIGIWYSVNDLLGWPTADSLPTKFQIHWIVIEEPNKKTGDEGSIYIWASDLNPQPNGELWKFHSMDDSGEPRAHRMPYSRKLHEQSIAIMQIIKKGGQFKGTMKKPGELDSKSGKKKGKPGKRGGDFSKEQTPMFYQLPPPNFPVKNSEQPSF